MKGSDLKSILILEDHAGIADALRLILEEKGYHVAVWAREHPVLRAPFPDLIFLDLLLGGMDGRTICREIKADPSTRHIRVVLMSAHKRVASIATEVGADGWLLKPFELEAVFTLLEQSFGMETASPLPPLASHA